MNSYQTITQVIANIGKTQSTGVEVTLNTKNIVTKDFFWSTDLTFTKYKDRWKERTPDWKPAVYEQYDAPIRAIYSRRAEPHSANRQKKYLMHNLCWFRDNWLSKISMVMYVMQTVTR